MAQGGGQPLSRPHANCAPPPLPPLQAVVGEAGCTGQGREGRLRRGHRQHRAQPTVHSTKLHRLREHHWHSTQRTSHASPGTQGRQVGVGVHRDRLRRAQHILFRHKGHGAQHAARAPPPGRDYGRALRGAMVVQARLHARRRCMSGPPLGGGRQRTLFSVGLACRPPPLRSSALGGVRRLAYRGPSPAWAATWEGEFGRDIVLTGSSVRAAVHHSTVGGGHPRGEAAQLKIGPSPSPSTSVHRPADYKSAIPSLCVFHPIWVLGGGVLPRGLGHNLLMQFYSLGS